MMFNRLIVELFI